MTEEDILHQNGDYWVAKSPNPKQGYEVLMDVATHAIVVMMVGEGEGPYLGLERAIKECDLRAKKDSEKAAPGV